MAPQIRSKSRDWPEARDGASGLSKDLRAATCRDANKAARLESALPKQPQTDTREQRNVYGPRPVRLLPKRHRPCRSGSCRNDTGPRPKRLLPKRFRPPAEAAPAETLPALPKRLLPNSHPSRAGQIPPFRVARSRTGKVPTVGLQSGADLRGARGDSLVSERAGREGESCSRGTAGQTPHAQAATGWRVF